MRTTALVLVATFLPFCGPAQARDLSFEDRVSAQRAIERVYYSHQTGVTTPFEVAVPQDVLERKVRTYLKQSVILERRWHVPVTAEMLHREMDRMTNESHMPERLRELYAALGNDPFVIQECLARAGLVDRMTRSFFAYDETIHRTERKAAVDLREQLVSGALDPSADSPRRAVFTVSRESSSGTSDARTEEGPGSARLNAKAFERWRAMLPHEVGGIGVLRDEREAFVIRVLLEQEENELRVAAFSVPKAGWHEWWSRVEAGLDERSVQPVASINLDASSVVVKSSATSCVPDDTWDNGTLDDIPAPRMFHTTVWTGSVMIVWGGDVSGDVNTGSRYDPATDTWSPTSMVNAPDPRTGHSMTWTGSRMIVWGGHTTTTSNTGGQYDPATDTWSPTSTTNAPHSRQFHSVVWTGSAMIVWGGTEVASSEALDTGGRYDPVTDTWTPTSLVGVPIGRLQHSALWADGVMLIWGGCNKSFSTRFNDGGRYDPVTDTWTPISLSGAPVGRRLQTAVWTGSRMIVWGGLGGGDVALDSGGSYDPAMNTWVPTSTVAPPTARALHSAIWTGSAMIVWGGWNPTTSDVATGARYDAATDGWTPLSVTNAPTPRESHSSVWTGSQMIVWGGTDGGTLYTGGRYDPATDSWTPTSTGSAPQGRSTHTAVWTGSQMIVWGGTTRNPDNTYSYLNTGGRYDPATSSWTPTSTLGAPVGRTSHTAVWTGSRMIVWGGLDASGGNLSSGGRYDPVADVWTPTSNAGVPLKRFGHTAVWTGSRMVIWGGLRAPSALNTGGLYDPATNHWDPTSTLGAPEGRYLHTAVWTGDLMIVWAGSTASGLAINTGGRYHPATDSWTPTSTVNPPLARTRHTAVWTGSRMIVWGGNSPPIRNGFSYDPPGDTWTAISFGGAPTERADHTAVWTGSRMIIWGGKFVTSGGRYNPSTDSWASTSEEAAPEGRSRHTAVWTGSAMIVWGGEAGGYTNNGGQYVLGDLFDADGDGYTECGGDCNDAQANVFPGSGERCDALDNDCNGAIDDLAGPPPALTGLVFLAKNEIQWSVILGAAYDVVRGDLTVLRTSAGDFTSATLNCLGNALAYPSASEPGNPAVGSGWFYVVRASGCAQNGTYDDGAISQQGSRDAEIAASPNACP